MCFFEYEYQILINKAHKNIVNNFSEHLVVKKLFSLHWKNTVVAFSHTVMLDGYFAVRIFNEILLIFKRNHNGFKLWKSQFYIFNGIFNNRQIIFLRENLKAFGARPPKFCCGRISLLLGMIVIFLMVISSPQKRQWVWLFFFVQAVFLNFKPFSGKSIKLSPYFSTHLSLLSIYNASHVIIYFSFPRIIRKYSISSIITLHFVKGLAIANNFTRLYSV